LKKLYRGYYGEKMGDGHVGGFGLIFPLVKWMNDWVNKKENCSEVTII